MSDRVIGYINEDTGEAWCAGCVDADDATTIKGQIDFTSDLHEGELIDKPWICEECGAAILGELSAEGLSGLADDCNTLSADIGESCPKYTPGILEHAHSVVRLAAQMTANADQAAKARAEAPPVVTLAFTDEEADYLIGALDEAWEANDDRLNDRGGCDPQDAQPMQEQNAAWMQLREKVRLVRYPAGVAR